MIGLREYTPGATDTAAMAQGATSGVTNGPTPLPVGFGQVVATPDNSVPWWMWLLGAGVLYLAMGSDLRAFGGHHARRVVAVEDGE